MQRDMEEKEEQEEQQEEPGTAHILLYRKRRGQEWQLLLLDLRHAWIYIAL